MNIKIDLIFILIMLFPKQKKKKIYLFIYNLNNFIFENFMVNFWMIK